MIKKLMTAAALLGHGRYSFVCHALYDGRAGLQ